MLHQMRLSVVVVALGTFLRWLLRSAPRRWNGLPVVHICWCTLGAAPPYYNIRMSRIGSVPTTRDPNTSAKVSRYKWEAYRDTNWWCIYYVLRRWGILLQKYRNRNGRCIAILFESIGVRGRFDSPDRSTGAKPKPLNSAALAERSANYSDLCTSWLPIHVSKLVPKQSPKDPPVHFFSTESDSVVFCYSAVNVLRIVIHYSKFANQSKL